MKYKLMMVASIALFTTFNAAAQVEQVPMQVSTTAPENAIKSPRVTQFTTWGEVSYGTPSKNGRKIFGDLVPYGEVWRTGANMSTDITFKRNVQIAGTEIMAGTYSLFTIPGEKEWTIILNAVPNQKGTSTYEANASKNVLQTKVKAASQVPMVEKLIIMPGHDALKIMWDNVSVTIPVMVK